MRAPFFVFSSRERFDAEIAKQASEACEQITTEMGAEIHDDLIQKLSIFRLYIDRMERSLQHPDEIENIVLKMRGEFQEVVDAVRKISRQLLPAKMEGESFQDTINILCQNMSRGGTDLIHFSGQGETRDIPPSIEIHLYRIVQELINNAFKHSVAWHIWVRLTWQSDALIIEVEDDGTGFHKLDEFIERLRKKHNTLRMRAQVINGTIQYQHGQRGLLATVKYPF
ncbi:sensor histidine kinase [Pseudochryseolinea flava]|uniref:Signal transduction histidine kinase subgroup 3 dimerisation and phosphoacceptor domain-containing protein n=1 Tax=Pseudochryseolinea flava TaxID=2059302 RepID=A0A364Y5M5_9BACT|nr:ATP-binding protein [Pseudochryseolinea flava]RAW01661.1 hypothetical protein DQQ10_08380 [Pseudochryseolinea flava]